MTGRGRLITVEGLEGAGKTTCLQTIAATLQEGGVEAPIFTREPGGTPFGEALRAVLLDPDQSGVTAEAEALTVFAARAEHLAQVIRPALDAGRWVVSDRFTDATYAYQGGGRGLGDDRVAVLEDWVHGGLGPDLTLLLDIGPQAGRERLAERGEGADRLEREDDPFFQAVRAAYHRRRYADPNRFCVIDAHQAPERVAAEVSRAVASLTERTPWRKP